MANAKAGKRWLNVCPSVAAGTSSQEADGPCRTTGSRYQCRNWIRPRVWSRCTAVLPNTYIQLEI